VLDACEEGGIAFLPYFPLGPGGLGDAESVVRDVAEAHNTTREAVALSWLLQRSPAVVPIPGTSSPEHLAANVAAAGLELSREAVERLNAA
jgi:Aldo/keto reductases, related to diketogulonate reductase